MEYLSFDLRLSEWSPISRTGVAEVLQCPVGESPRYSFTLETEPFSPGMRVERTNEQAAELGQKLLESVLHGQSLTLWHESYQIARERHRGLRLRLHVDPWPLAQLPWELLYDRRWGEFLAFDPRVSIVRYIRLLAVPPTLRQSPQLRVVVASASPGDQAALDWQGEVHLLQEALHDLTSMDRIKIFVCDHLTCDGLHSCLLEHTPDVFHFVGHADFDPTSHQGYLLLEDERGLSDPLLATDAARLLRRYGTSLVMLNACKTAQGAWAGLSPALVRAEVPAVVSMQWPVEDRAAAAFGHAFYQALSLGHTIDECVAEARVRVNATTADPNDWGAPVLFLRSLSGQLWTQEVIQSYEVPHMVPALTASAISPADNPEHMRSSRDQAYFKTRGPLVSPADERLIIDRPELRRALRIAQQPAITHYIAFLSARQTGKTSVLFRLMDLLRTSYASVFVDLSVLGAQNARSCFRYVAFRLISEFRMMLGADLPLPETHDMETPVDFLEFLRELAALVPFPRILVLFDEVGALAPGVSDGFFNTLRTVFTQGRSPTDSLTKYLFVFSGAVDLYDLTFGSVSPLNICEKLYLRDFQLSDVATLVRGFGDLGIPVEQGAAEHIHRLSGGHPYLTMRICALMEQAQVDTVAAPQIEAAAQQMLIDDDNIRHIIRNLNMHPHERRRLRQIVEGSQIPFSRNDPGLAMLEMIGVIRPVQPCEIRNELYRRALELYFTRQDEAMEAPMVAQEPSDRMKAMYVRLRTLHEDVLAVRACGGYGERAAWSNYAAALFSMLPAFSVLPRDYADAEQHYILLAINHDVPQASYWNAYQPGILVSCGSLNGTSAETLIERLVTRAHVHRVKLAILMTMDNQDGQEHYGGTRDAVTVIVIDDCEVGRLLEERGDFEELVRAKILAARLRKI
ncbi:MAG: CHAT domain-containing protein [Anaerolineae bacterium]|nr:CHAT domain-containing protein [Anaerolineae bacterium]